jgi:hypothetical protein
MKITIEWKVCRSYKEAEDFQNGVYLFEWWNGRPFYWGVVDKAIFGGNPRKVNGVKVNPRYGRSYKHLISGFLRHGGMLYFGKLNYKKDKKFVLTNLENFLINKYPSEENKEVEPVTGKLEVIHIGNIPSSIIWGELAERALK